MKLIADEGVDASLVNLLREANHDVLYFAEFEPSTDDEVILTLANDQHRILIHKGQRFWRIGLSHEKSTFGHPACTA